MRFPLSTSAVNAKGSKVVSMWTRFSSLVHRVLLAVGIRNPLDYAPPALGPEVNHPFLSHSRLACCDHCGGGSRHAIHKTPWDPRRTLEVLGVVKFSEYYAHPEFRANLRPVPAGQADIRSQLESLQ